MSTRLLVSLVATGMLLQTGISHADAIDGDWCSTDGMRMSIRAEKITTPGGNQIEGNYSRHAFDYVIPACIEREHALCGNDDLADRPQRDAGEL
jgi:hypothetical protein